MSMIIICAALAVILAIIFFGFLAKSGGEKSLLNISGVERAYNESVGENGVCAVVYVGVSYESLHINAEKSELLKLICIIERKIGEQLKDGAAARVDGNSFVIAEFMDEDAAAKFCGQLEKECAVFSGMTDVNVGVYAAKHGEDFIKAAGYAKKAARYAKKLGVFYKICGRDSLGEIIESEQIERNIENYIDNDCFYLLFQPLVDAKSGKLFGCEVLARLKNEHGYEVLPGKFLETIKKENLSRKFDLYILEKCCRRAERHRESSLYIACNFSRRSLESVGISEEMLDIAKNIGAEPGRIIIELEDGQSDSGMLDENIKALKNAGFKICMDDFGRGNTAFGELSGLSPDIIGIDKSVLYAAQNEWGAHIFESTVKLAGAMKAKVLCMGIENDEQKRSAISAGCDILQGFYLYRPMSESEFDNLFKNNIFDEI